MQCESVNLYGLTAVRLNGVVSIYDNRFEQPVKKIINNDTPLEVLVGRFFSETIHFVGNVK